MSCLSVCLSFWLWASSQEYSSSQGRRHGATIGGGGVGRGPFGVDSYHAPPIRIMLKAEKFAGDRSPRPPPPVQPPMAVRQFTQIPRLVLFTRFLGKRTPLFRQSLSAALGNHLQNSRWWNLDRRSTHSGSTCNSQQPLFKGPAAARLSPYALVDKASGQSAYICSRVSNVAVWDTGIMWGDGGGGMGSLFVQD